MRVFAHRSTFPSGTSLVPDTDITLSRFSHVATFGNHRITTGVEADISLSRFSHAATFNALTISLAPPDASISLVRFSHAATFNPLTIGEAPPDANIRLTRFSHAATFGTLVVSLDDETDDDFGPIGFSPAGGSPI